MTTTLERTKVKVYTPESILCTICNKNSNFLYVVKREDSKYYLLEMCGKCNKHCNDIHEIPLRMIDDYPAIQK